MVLNPIQVIPLKITVQAVLTDTDAPRGLFLNPIWTTCIAAI